MHIDIQNWKKLNKSGDGPWPEERSSHAACCLNYGQQFPQLLVSGGVDRENMPLADLWILDIERVNWREASEIIATLFLLCRDMAFCPIYNFVIQVTVGLRARWCHSLTAFSLGPGLTEVIEFGGTPQPWTGSDERQPRMANTTLLDFSEY